MNDPQVVAHSESLDGVIDRRAEAERVADFILSAKRKLVVLYGKPGSGKTELIKRWVIPILRATREREGGEVLYGDCGRGLPEVLQGVHGPERIDDVVTRRAIVFIDNFEHVLDLPRDERRDVLDRLFVRLQAEDTEATAVLVTDTRQLTSVYGLTSYDPEIASAVLEVPSAGIAEGLQQLSSLDPETAVTYGPEVLHRLSEDSLGLEEQGWEVTFDFVKLLDARFRRLRAESGERSVEPRHYDDMDGLTGILRAHLEAELEKLEAERKGNEEIARAILERVLDAQAQRAAADFADIAPRLGVSSDELGAVRTRLTESGGLLRQPRTGEYQLVPPQLGAIVKEDVATRDRQNERVRRIVEEGLRSWQHLGNLLPRPRFLEVHHARTELVLHNEHVRFLLHCALRHEDGGSVGAAEYWLRRVGERADGMDILLAALFDDFRDVRVRSAALLRDFREPEVRSRLQILALTDPDLDVRAQAVSSLEPMQDDALMELFIKEAQEPKSPHRTEAIEALRIFRNGTVASVLQALVNDPGTERELREKAIGALSRLNMQQAADALVDIALHDQDEEDREEAARALALTTSEDLNRRILHKLGPPRSQVRTWLARGLVGIAGVVFVYMAFRNLGWFIEERAAVWLLLLVVSFLLLPATSAVLLRLRDQRARRASLLGVLGMGLFALSAVSIFFWLHGLAHVITKRWGRGLLLLGLEILGLVLALAVASVPEVLSGFGWAAWFYTAAGLFLFFGSYLYDIIGVLLSTMVLTDTARREQRKAAVYHELLTNQVAAGLVFDTLRSQERSDVRWARGLLRRFGARVQSGQLIHLLTTGDRTSLPLVLRALGNRKADDADAVPRLVTLWRTADAGLRRSIAEILLRKPDKQSLEALHSVRSDMGPVLKLRSGLAKGQFSFAVFPVYAWLLLLLSVPAAGFLVYHGIMVLKNPAWSQIVSLGRRTFSDARDQEMITTVTVLERHYQRESAEALLTLFEKGSHRHRPSVHATIAQALVTIHDTLAAASGSNEPEVQRRLQRIHEQLIVQVSDFHELLQGGWPGYDDSLAAIAGAEVLRSMANAADSVLANTAIQLLVGSVLAPDSARRSQEGETRARSEERAIHALGSVRYERALLALDSLFVARKGGPLEREILNQIERVVARAYAALRDQDPTVEGPKLLALMSRMHYKPAQVRDVSRLVQEAEKAGEACDRNADGRCDGKDDALRLIVQSPSTEDAYRDLLGHYLEQEQYRDAVAIFIELREQYPTSIWPRKILAEIYHEYLAREDTSFFYPSYDEMVKLRGLRDYAQLKADTAADYLRIEADFAEIVLSARRYGELEAVARQLMGVTQDPVYRLNLALFVYAAYVMQHDVDSARAKLTQLGEVMASLPPDFYNNWVYPGTVEFIQQSDLPDSLRTALLDLCNEGFWYEPEEGKAIIDRNQFALELLRRR